MTSVTGFAMTGSFAWGACRFLAVRRGGALLPTVVPTDFRSLSCPPIGALPRNRLASSATGGASPISPPAGDREGRPYGGLQVVQGAGRCRHRPLRNLQGVLTGRRGNRRSAASGRGSEPVSRKCPDWRPRQWPGIGWHDGGQENPAPTEGLQGVREKNPPVTGSQ